MKIKYLIKILVILILFSLVLNFSLAKEEQEIRSELLKLIDVKKEMGTAGMGVARISDLITEGFLHFNNKNYDKAKEIISLVYELRNISFNIQRELSLTNQLYLDIKEKNISLVNITNTQIEWNFEYCHREFEKENYEQAWKTLVNIKKALLNSLINEYGYLNDSLLVLEEKIDSLELSKSGITALKSLLSEALEIGKLEELEIIEQEFKDLNKSLVYYEEIKLITPDLESKNLSVERIRDEIRVAELDLSFSDYKAALNKLESLKNLTQEALSLERGISELEKSIVTEKTKSGINFEEAQALLEQAKYELIVGNYEEAEQKLISAKDGFESLKAEFLIGRLGSKSLGVSLKEFIRKNWAYILLVILIIIVVLKLTYRTLDYEIKRRWLARLKKELRVSKKMVQGLQRNYFVYRKMSRESYDKAYEGLQEKIVNLREKLSLLNKKIKKVEQPNK